MQLHTSPTLSGLRKALQAPQPHQMAEFLKEVMEPIRPCWETPLRHMGQVPSDQHPALLAAQRFLFYTPSHGPERGLQALQHIEDSGAASQSMRLLKQAVDLLQPEAHGITLPDMHFAFVLGDPDRMAPPLYTGAGNVPGWILLMAFPTAENLPKLPAIPVHEFHHQIRFQYEPLFPQMTLGKYLVAEGLAEVFAASLCGEERLGPWATTLTPSELEPLKPRFAAALHCADFTEVRGYIFGDWAARDWGTPALGIPDFAGYAIGYRLVQAYLQKTGQNIVQATYAPWLDIVEKSGFFEGLL